MAQYLSEEWLDEVATLSKAQPKRPGVAALLQIVVGGAPEGDVKWSWAVKDGKVAKSTLGVADDADVTLTLPYDVAVAVAQGELDLNAAFMQGRMKVAGDMGKMLELLPITRTDDYLAFQEQLRAATTF